MNWFRSPDGNTIHTYPCQVEDKPGESRELILWAQGASLATLAEHFVGGGIAHQVRPCPSCLGNSGPLFHDVLLEHLHQTLITVDARTCRNEYDLQVSIATALAGAGVRAEREHTFPGGARPDLWLPSYRIAVEVKTQGSPAQIRRQLDRYAAVDDVEAVALVTTQNRHRPAVTKRINGTPARAIALTGAAL